MRKKTIFILALAISLCAVSSCRKLITDEFPDMEPKPVVNAIIRSGDSITVYVSLAGKIDDQPPHNTENATVRLFVDDVLAEELTHTGNGVYKSGIVGEQGKHYKIEVDIPDFPTVSGKTYMPYSESVRNIQHILSAGKDADGANCPALKISFTTHPEEMQYFELLVKNVGSRLVRHIVRVDSVTNELVIDSVIEHYGGSNLSFINISDPVILGEALPLTVFSNRMIKDTTYTMYLEYTTNSHSGGTSTGGVWEMNLYPLVIELRSIDVAYYHYLRSFYLYDRVSDIGEIYPPYSLYSNVDGGFGIVAAYSQSSSDTIFFK